MAGDLLTSFLKRRLGMASSTSAPLIDQLAECLFPAMVCVLQLGLSLIDVFVIVAIFTLSDIILGVARAAFFTRLRSN
jgi:CDP-2,3-bis-(O-geranylgeranyl)-sn-glycerol synthase